MPDTEKPTDLISYLEKAKHNLDGPFPKCVSLSDDLLSDRANSLDNNQYLTSAQLFQIAFGSWRAGVVLSLAGAANQVPALLRHALESAVYAYLFARNKEWEFIWWNRETDPKAKKKLRGRDGPMKEAKELLQLEDSKLKEKLFNTLQILIDFGAHPNVFLFVDNTELDAIQETTRYTTKLLGTEETRNSAFLMSSGVAIDLACVYRLIWPVRFGASEEMLLGEVIGQAEVFRNYHHSRDYSGSQ